MVGSCKAMFSSLLLFMVFASGQCFNLSALAYVFTNGYSRNTAHLTINYTQSNQCYQYQQNEGSSPHLKSVYISISFLGNINHLDKISETTRHYNRGSENKTPILWICMLEHITKEKTNLLGRIRCNI